MGEPFFLVSATDQGVETVVLVHGLPWSDTMLIRRDSIASAMSIQETMNGRIGILQLPYTATGTAQLFWADGTVTTYPMWVDAHGSGSPPVACIQDQQIIFFQLNAINEIHARSFDLETGEPRSETQVFVAGTRVENVLPLPRSSYILVKCGRADDYHRKTLYLLDQMTMSVRDSVELYDSDGNNEIFNAVATGPWIVGRVDRSIFRWKPKGMAVDVRPPSKSDEAWSVKSEDGSLVIDDVGSAEPTTYVVYTSSGALVASSQVSGRFEARLQAGLYLIQRVTPTSRSVRYCLNMK